MTPSRTITAPISWTAGAPLALFRRLCAILALLLALAPVAACSSENQAVLHTTKGSFPFNIEIAENDAQRERGLMYRQTLAPDAGMLFDFFREQPVAFWMQNTLIPLDMVFIGADGLVKSIHVNARPMDTTSIPSGVPVRFVLEIPGGRSVEIGLAPGDRFENARVGSAPPPAK